jgi:hypothetical protein
MNSGPGEALSRADPPGSNQYLPANRVKSHDPERPVVCVAETSKQLVAEMRVRIGTGAAPRSIIETTPSGCTSKKMADVHCDVPMPQVPAVVSIFRGFLRLSAQGTVVSSPQRGEPLREFVQKAHCVNNEARQIMTTFTLLFIDASENIDRSRQIESPTDEQAVDMAAREPGDYRAVQIWNGDRFIALRGNPRGRAEG